MSEDKKTIEVDYEIGEEVKIKVNGVLGKINGIWVDVNRINYNVEWVSTTSAVMNKWFVKEELSGWEKLNRE